jgi:hypothetical protein
VAIVHPGPIDTPLFAQASSATGLQPRVAPESYSAAMVAQALVEVTVRPRAEVVLGGETRLLDLMFLLARPVGEGAMLAIDRWFRSGDEPADRPGSLWVAPRHPQSSGGIPARDSLLAPFQLGRRLLPAPATPLRFLGHVAIAAWRARGIAGALRQPATEQPPPAAGLADAPHGRPARAGTATL